MKKIILILLTLLLAAGIIFGTIEHIGIDKLQAFLASSSFDVSFKSEQPLSTYNYDCLSDTEKQAYISIFNNIKGHPHYIKIPRLSENQFNNVFFAVKNDNPQMLCFSDSCNMLVFLTSCLLELHYDNTADECNRMTYELSQKADEIIGHIPKYCDDYETELYIHDHIITTCDYLECENDSNAYGCLVAGKAVCSGYSRATMLLLNKAGIDSILIGGTGISETQGKTSHMWNVVWLDDVPYQLDTTWDDPANGNSDQIVHIYFNVTSDDIKNDHTDQKPEIDCTADDMSYFVKEGLYFSEYNNLTLLEIEKKLVKNIETGRNYIEFRFSDGDAYAQSVAELSDNIDENSDIYNLITYIGNSVGEKVDISHINFSKDDDMKYIKLMFDTKE